MTKEILSWSDVEHLTNNIAGQMAKVGWTPSIIVGITRGGLIPATLMSHLVGAAMATVNVNLRDKHEAGRYMPTEVGTFDLGGALDGGENVLVIDDINDSGATFNLIRYRWSVFFPTEQIKFAALVHNEASPERTDFYGRLINKDINPIWIDYPWESWYQDRR